MNAPIAKATTLNQGLCEAFIVVVLMGSVVIMAQAAVFFQTCRLFPNLPSFSKPAVRFQRLPEFANRPTITFVRLQF
jgi:hypothetical protein